MSELEFKKTIKKLITDLSEVEYSKGDVSDLGNEIGFSIGLHLDSEDKIEDFIQGLRHGISIVDGTHG